MLSEEKVFVLNGRIRFPSRTSSSNMYNQFSVEVQRLRTSNV
jgi:hypothetical protein